jgi:melanoma-associated antigen p97
LPSCLLYAQALVAEDYGKGAVEYDAVAVVRKSFCDANPTATLASLRGARSCHTGYRRTAGWSMAVGYMVTEGIMAPVNNLPNVENDAETVAAFFNTTCAPRTSGNGPANGANNTGALWPGICTGCVNVGAPRAVGVLVVAKTKIAVVSI